MKPILKISSLIGMAAVTVNVAAKTKPWQLPNVIFFLVDDLGWMDIGCNGSTLYETPNIDRLAAQGVRFTQAYSTCHVSSPARASILTGRYPASINMTDWLPGRKNFPFQMLENVVVNQHLPREELTVAEVLQANGYKTGIIGKWHLGEGEYAPETYGFDVHIPKGYEKGWPVTYHAPFQLNGYNGLEGEYLTDALTADALKFIEQSAKDPFFLYFSHYAVHDPIQGRADLVDKCQKKLASQPPPKPLPYILEGNPDDPEPLSREELNELLNHPEYRDFKVLPQRTVKIRQHQDNPQFAAMVESVDESLGRVMAKLSELGLDDNTVIIFFSDNGGMSAANFGNPARIIRPEQLNKAFSSSNLPLRGAKGWLYEGGIRVPMIVKWPGHTPVGAVSDVPVISTDFFPTLLDMLHILIPKDKKIEGVSITPLLIGNKKIKKRALYWHFPHYSNHGMQSPGGAIRYGDYKLIEYFEHGTVQLFNIRDDESEQNDLSASLPDVAFRLQKMLHKWRKETRAHMMTGNPEYRLITPTSE
ncbi:MAG: sulfatase [Tannerella sp.]|jgi:arylsulfatase A-like enzyme|nr:sulfatase [Tannerella sp.]